jgi:hypothetical protein
MFKFKDELVNIDSAPDILDCSIYPDWESLLMGKNKAKPYHIYYWRRNSIELTVLKGISPQRRILRRG